MSKIYQKMYLQYKNRFKSVLGGFIRETVLGFYSKRLVVKQAGFTLIELLVVVLIIGILAAIALPQYQTAVAKSRLATLMPIVKSLKDGAEMYRLAKGHYPVYTMADVLGSLDVSLPGNCVINADNRNAACGDQRYSLVLSDSVASGTRGYVQGSDTNGEVGYVMYFDHSNLPGKIYCLATRTNKAANNVCKSMGGVLDNSGLQWSINSIPCYGYLLN